MREIGFAALVLALLVGADDAESARDLAAMQGSWTMVSSEVNGESTSDQVDVMGRLSVTDDRYATTRDGRQTSYTFRLESSSDPKAIELAIENGPAKGQIIKGIYKLNGELFTVCHGLTPRDDRPVEFSTGAESGHTLIVWRRAEPRAK
jgi:uncharacterized protein (TIGR03067 family)